MIDIEDFKDKDGRINWKALEAARVQAGERCKKCDDYIFINTLAINPQLGPRLCVSCQNLEHKNEVEHERFIRCPKCGNEENITDTMDWHEIYEDGQHKVDCEKCDHGYEIGTRIEYYFTSPERIK